MKLLMSALFLMVSIAPALAAYDNKTGDAEILGLIAAIDRNEIRAAEEAIKKQTNPIALGYAQMLKQQHAYNLEKTKDVARKEGIQPSETAAVEKQITKGAEERAKLAPFNGEEFAKAYINTMIQGHIEAIDMIDNQLMVKAVNPEVKKHLFETREHIDSHLEKAKEIQYSLVQ
jgi:putative membrane protein